MLQGHIRVIRRHFLHHFPPQPGGVQHIGLVHAGDLLPALPGDVKALDGDAADFVLIIGQGVDGLAHAVLFNGFPFTEIQSAGQLPHNQHVETRFTDFLLQGTGCRQLVIEHRGPQIREQIQGLADSQKPCLRAQVGGKLVPGGFRGVSADGAHQHGVRCLCLRHGLLRQRDAVHVDGSPSHEDILKDHPVPISFRHLLQYFLRFSNNLRPDAVAGNACDM